MERVCKITCSYTVVENCRVKMLGKRNCLSKNKSDFPDIIIKKNKTWKNNIIVD